MKSILCLSTALSFAAATAALAEQTYSNNGVGTAQATSTMHEIAEGHVLVEIESSYSNIAPEDESNPLNGATGPCFGSMEIMAPNISGAGHCVYTDADGDIAIIAWNADTLGEGGATGGEWSLTGGNGKYAGGSGGGRYDVVTDAATGAQTNTVTGEITLP
ncbi:hypothetical protein DEA8626_01361 [Defluviimonas aquaemixtae]|uniref:Uncharacterized protein n=1 Tax=Albidovulum aquaemixtae TaxID=1542388 RepID=A0A2R8B5E8_9RHOB|nr:hypothetical protein [Defluviimonas aquaemixtae]SPH17834.1 hypothetical protein DEA8626_01361 [Defluviimonas aquaemixtae]